jgi:predicted  nucleic acid-binding Zn-ribbon protein
VDAQTHRCHAGRILQAEILKLKKVAREMKGKQTDAEAQKQEVSTLQSQVEHLERSVKRADERCSETKQGKYVKEEAATRAINTLRSELSSMQDELSRVKDERRVADIRKGELEAEVR